MLESSNSSAVSRRQLVSLSTVAGVTTLLLPSVVAAASSSGAGVGNGVCDWDRLPFLSGGGSTIVQGFTVTATTNSAIQGDTANTYLYQSNVRIKTVLTFSPYLYDLKLVMRNHADGVSETFTFTWKKGAVTDSTAVVTNVDTTKYYTFAGGIDTMIVDYTHPTPATATQYGSYLDIWLPCV